MIFGPNFGYEEKVQKKNISLLMKKLQFDGQKSNFKYLNDIQELVTVIDKKGTNKWT